MLLIHPNKVFFPRVYLSNKSKSLANFAGFLKKSFLVINSFLSKFLTNLAGFPA